MSWYRGGNGGWELLIYLGHSFYDMFSDDMNNRVRQGCYWGQFFYRDISSQKGHFKDWIVTLSNTKKIVEKVNNFLTNREGNKLPVLHQIHIIDNISDELETLFLVCFVAHIGALP